MTYVCRPAKIRPPAAPTPVTPAPNVLHARLGRLVDPGACWVKTGLSTECRGVLRLPFDEPIVLTPWDSRTGAALAPASLASGREISSRGLSFSHERSIPHRSVAVSFRTDRLDESGTLAIETIVVRLIWCRFTRKGEYLSGGRFDGILPDEFGAPLAPLLLDSSDQRDSWGSLGSR